VTDDGSLETILALIKQLDAMLVGLEQLRPYVGNRVRVGVVHGVGREMLDLLIEEGQTKLAEAMRKLIQ
jgi:hypothetical protein